MGISGPCLCTIRRIGKKKGPVHANEQAQLVGMQAQKHKKRINVSLYSKNNTAFSGSQAADAKSFTGHELLRGDFDPDVRPFTWSRKGRVRRDNPEEVPEKYQMELFDYEFQLTWFNDPIFGNSQIRMPQGKCDDCPKTMRTYNYTSSYFWFRVATWTTVLCHDCFAKRQMTANALETWTREDNSDDDEDFWT